MLARGVLGRLAAATDAPKTSTHDLARISRVLARAVIARNASSFALTGSVSHAYKLAYAIARRSYATATTKKAPAKTVEKVTVKKTVTKKPAAKKSATKKQPAAKKKAAPKKPKAKKVAPKKKPVKRVPTEKTLATREKRKQLDAYKALKEAALTSPKKIVDNAWTVFLNEKGTKGGVAFAASQASTEFKALSPSEREHYNHLANQNKATNEAAYKAWVLSHTPEQIRLANNARRALRKLYTKRKEDGFKTKAKTPAGTEPLKDERIPKHAPSSSALFVKARLASGDMAGIASTESLKLIGAEWKALSASEKKKYQDLAEAAKAKYAAEFQTAFGRPPAFLEKTATA